MTASFEATTEFQHFKNTMRRVLGVPKVELEKLLEKEKKAKARRKAKRTNRTKSHS